ARCALDQLTIADDAAADTRANEDDDEIVDVPTGAEGVLPRRRDLDIVANDRRDAELFGQQLRHLEVDHRPAQVGGAYEQPALGVDLPGDADTDADHLLHGRAGLVDGLARDVVDALHQLIRPVAGVGL